MYSLWLLAVFLVGVLSTLVRWRLPAPFRTRVLPGAIRTARHVLHIGVRCGGVLTWP
jgi:hypothetical protein